MTISFNPFKFIVAIKQLNQQDKKQEQHIHPFPFPFHL